MLQKEITPPKKIMVLCGSGGIKTDVLQVVIHPKGAVPVIRPEYVPVELRTEYGSRFYGFENAYIGSDLRVHCSGYNPNFEELKAWEILKRD